MKIAKQLLKEFWIPLLVSIAWVIYNINENKTMFNITSIINIFGPTFFLLSWLTGQFFRVTKQTKVEDSFKKIEIRTNKLIDEIEEKTNKMISHISGGNSFPSSQVLLGNSYSSYFGCFLFVC